MPIMMPPCTDVPKANGRHSAGRLSFLSSGQPGIVGARGTTG